MIYETIALDAPIQQGDIFKNIPRVDISLQRISVVAKEQGEEVAKELEWTRAIADPAVSDEANGRIITGILPIHPVHGLVITQNCDALRAEALSLCEIGPMSVVASQLANLSPGSKAWIKLVTRQSTETLRWFYLPSDKSIGFTDRMAVDFRTTISIPRTDLEALRALRIGRLNHVAYEHFREKLAEFFRRYPVDPWYPLTKEELESYVKESGEAEPYPWQK